jgi:hypothetical protein
MARVCIFLTVIALIAGMVGCGGTTPAKYTLTMAVAGGNGTAIDLTNASPYTVGTVVSIRAVAATGYYFVNWTSTAGTFANATAAETAFAMPAQDTIVSANFALEIWDWYDLDAIRNNLIGDYILMNDLDSTTAGYEELASPTANNGTGWQPIGGALDERFGGLFRGQGYKIKDLCINRPDEWYIGLFGCVYLGVIKDIAVVNATVTGNAGVGSVVGYNYCGTVSNSYSTGNVTGNTFWLGGLVGINGNGGTISDSYSTTSASGSESVGGLVGENDGIVTSCYATGNVIGYHVVGGLVGINEAGTVNHSYSTGVVNGTITVGGLVGGNYNTVTNSYSMGNVVSTGTYQIGGLVGGNGGIVNNSFWDTETSGQSTSDGGTGKTTAEMKDIATFSGAGWNITAVANPSVRNPAYSWNIVDNVTYPFLSWQPV